MNKQITTQIRHLWLKLPHRKLKRIPGIPCIVRLIKRMAAYIQTSGKEYEEINGIKIWLADDPNQEIALGYLPYIKKGTFERISVEIFHKVLKAGNVVVDIGASFGYFTCIASWLVGPKGKVFAFEPEKTHFII